MKKFMFGLCLLASAMFAAASHAQSGGGAGGGGAGGAGASGGAGGTSGTGTSGGTTSSGSGATPTASSPSAQQAQSAARQQGLPSTQPNTLNTSTDQFNQGGSTQFTQPGPGRFNQGAAQSTQQGALRGQGGQLLQSPQSSSGDRAGLYRSDTGYGAQEQFGTQGSFDNRQAAGQDGITDRMPPPDNQQARQSRDATRDELQGSHQGQRGELGVWLAASPGPGVEIRSVTPGSAAEEAGLEQGDVLLQVNGRAVSSPTEVQRMIRAIPAGQSAMLEIWRDGTQHEVPATLQSARENHRVGYRGGGSRSSGGDMAARTERLEEQVGMLMRELQQIRAQMQEIHSTARAGQPARTSMQPSPTDPGAAAERSLFDGNATDQNRPQAAMPNEQPAAPAAASSGGPTTGLQQSGAEEPATQTSDDLFGNQSTDTTADEAAPAESEPEPETRSDTDSLFQ